MKKQFRIDSLKMSDGSIYDEGYRYIVHLLVSRDLGRSWLYDKPKLFKTDQEAQKYVKENHNAL